MDNKKIVIATHNLGKAEEFKELFAEFGVAIETLHDYPDIPEVEETGSTFQENALLKAQTISDYLDQVVLADDSGLLVDALNGEPGVYSARYAGEPTDDTKNNDKLLKALKNIPDSEKTARFHCSLALVGPNKEPLHVTGEVTGFILDEPRGTNGFGYDPLFYLAEFEQTMAQLSQVEKNKISHRAIAIRELKDHLHDWL